MCLKIESKTMPRFSTAKENIKVYKVLERDFYGNLVTPYQTKPVPSDGVMKVRKRKDVNTAIKLYCSDRLSSLFEVESGAIHSCLTKKRAQEIVNYSADYRVIFHAIIPKGAKFLKGSRSEICSTELRIKMPKG